ncbi:hypothetical protein [Nocardia thraciensis]
MTAHPAPAADTDALVPIYEAKNTGNGSQFVIYTTPPFCACSDYDDGEELYIVAHHPGGNGTWPHTPRLHVVAGTDHLAAYAHGAVHALRRYPPATAGGVHVANTAPEPLRSQLPD